MNHNKQAINETMAQFDRQGVYTFFDEQSMQFMAIPSFGFISLNGYDSIVEMLLEMNATYRALCGGIYTVETTLNTSTEVSLYLSKIGMKNSRVFKDGVEISPSEFETENW